MTLNWNPSVKLAERPGFPGTELVVLNQVPCTMRRRKARYWFASMLLPVVPELKDDNSKSWQAVFKNNSRSRFRHPSNTVKCKKLLMNGEVVSDTLLASSSLFTLTLKASQPLHSLSVPTLKLLSHCQCSRPHPFSIKTLSWTQASPLRKLKELWRVWSLEKVVALIMLILSTSIVVVRPWSYGWSVFLMPSSDSNVFLIVCRKVSLLRKG